MDQLLRQVIDLQNTFHDRVDDANAPAMVELRNETQKLVDEVKMQKNKVDLDEMLKNIIRTLEQCNDHSGMSMPHVNDLKSRCNNLRNEIRSL